MRVLHKAVASKQKLRPLLVNLLDTPYLVTCFGDGLLKIINGQFSGIVEYGCTITLQIHIVGNAPRYLLEFGRNCGLAENSGHAEILEHYLLLTRRWSWDAGAYIAL